MTQREVTGKDNVKWTCVEAYSSGDNEALAQKAKEVAGNGNVPVVCTPSGGAQSVRLDLPANWTDGMSDEQLAEAISKAAD
jgi:hypothetical protein